MNTKYKDLTGMKFGKLTVIKQGEDYVSPKGKHIKQWWCLCDCQLELPEEERKLVLVIGYQLTSGKTRSCRCLTKKDLTGQRFGRLLVIKKIQNYITSGGNQLSQYECLCDCGNYCNILGNQLSRGITKSCGCYRKENVAKINKKYKRKNNYWEKFDDYIYKFIDDKNIEGLISAIDYEKCKNHYWISQYNNHTKSYYFYTEINDSRIAMSRYILNITDNNVKVDHKNHDTTNNTRENLRITSNSQNTMNRRINSNNTSGITGVHWNKNINKWCARIGVNNKRISLGYFDRIEDAIKIRKDAEEKYFGEFSYDNSLK